jgi:hypothetical protein
MGGWSDFKSATDDLSRYAGDKFFGFLGLNNHENDKPEEIDYFLWIGTGVALLVLVMVVIIKVM